MEPIKLRLENFGSYVAEEVNFDDIQVACLVGPNGSGKSTLLDAITWALYGQGSKGSVHDLDNYVRREADECSVELTFRLNKHTYKVVRKRNKPRNKSALDIFEETEGQWNCISPKTIAECQTLIEKLLRMDYRTFVSSSLILQGQADSFSVMTDKERKDTLCRILGLGAWDEYLATIRDHLKDLKATSNNLESQINSLKNTLSQETQLAERNEQLQHKSAELERMLMEQEEAVNKLSQQLGTYDTITHQAEDCERQISACASRINAHKATLDRLVNESTQLQTLVLHRNEIEAAKEEAEMLRDIVNELKAAQDRAISLERALHEAQTKRTQYAATQQQKRAALETQINTCRKQAELLSRVPCGEQLKVKCALLANARQAQAQLTQLTQQLEALEQQVNPHDIEVANLETELKNLAFDPAEYEAASQQLAEAEKIAAKAEALKLAETRLAEIAASVKETQQHLRKEESELERLRKALDAYKTQLNQREACASSLKAAQQKLQMTRAELDTIKRELGSVQTMLSMCSDARKQLHTLQEQQQSIKTQQEILAILETACSKKAGVPALIIENAVPSIEQYANQLLQNMGSNLFVSFITQADTKSGTTQEVLRIIVTQEGEERPYSTFSGAERFQVDLAIRIALSKFLAGRAGAQIRFFALDEGLGCADANSRQAILNTLMAVAKEFGKVIVVTHIDEIKDMFPQRIEVRKGADGSHIRIF